MLSLVVVVAACVLSAATASENLVNSNVDRVIDLTNQLATITAVQKITNKGSSPATVINIANDAPIAGRLAYVTAKNTEDKKALRVNGNQVFVNIPAGGSVTIQTISVYTRTQIPFPAYITQSETQQVRFQGNVYFTSPYETLKQTTLVKTAGPIESTTKVQPFSKSDNKVTYGPFENQPANAFAELTVHFENNSPFLTVTNLVREIEVSHWGNVAITEDINLSQSGAILKGAFSRLDFDRSPTRSAVRGFVSKLPAAAKDVYYRDIIGNISTSKLREEKSAVVLEVQPRFPLLGGWKTFYTVGYNVPAYELLSRDGSEFRLRFRFVDHLYDNMVIDKATVRVILPETATNIKFSAPFPIDSTSDSVRVTYLDTVGRPVKIFEKTNLVEDHMQEVEITYTFSQSSLFREPFMVVTFFLIMFSVVIMCNRINFAIDTTSEQAQRKDRLEGARARIEDFREVFENRAVSVASLRQAVKDNDEAKNKATQKDLKDIAKQAEQLIASLQAVDAELAKKLADIVSLADKQLAAVTTKKSSEEFDEKIQASLDSLL